MSEFTDSMPKIGQMSLNKGSHWLKLLTRSDDVDGATAVKLQFLANAHLYHILLASASIGQILDLNKKEKLEMQIGMHEQQGKQIDENFTIEFR